MAEWNFAFGLHYTAYHPANHLINAKWHENVAIRRWKGSKKHTFVWNWRCKWALKLNALRLGAQKMFKHKTKMGYYRILYSIAFLCAFAPVIDMHEQRRSRARWHWWRHSDGLLAAILCVVDKFASECVFVHSLPAGGWTWQWLTFFLLSGNGNFTLCFCCRCHFNRLSRNNFLHFTFPFFIPLLVVVIFHVTTFFFVNVNEAAHWHCPPLLGGIPHPLPLWFHFNLVTLVLRKWQWRDK